MENNVSDIFKMEMSPKLRDDFRTAATWARIIAIMGFCACVCSLLINFKARSYVSAIVSAGLSVALYIFLLKFGTQVKKGLETNDQQMFNEGLINLRTYFKIIGVVLIIIIIIVILAMLFGVLGAMIGLRK